MMEITLREKFIALVDNDSIVKSDAIVLLEGDGYNRYLKAAQLFKKGFSEKIVFSGGITDYEYGSFPFDDILPKLISEGVPLEAIIHEAKSKNTLEQAKEVIKIAIKRKWSKIILVATHDHQYRAYLTFLKQVLNSKYKIQLYNSPARNLKWFDKNVWGRRIDNIEKEFKKIEKYMNLDHLASYDQAIKYQELKEKIILDELQKG